MKRHLYHILCLVGFLLVTYGFLAEFKSSGIKLNNYDKHLHFLIFWGLAALLHYTYKPKLWVAVPLLAVYGLLIEYMQQTFTRGRQAEFADWIADLAGVITFYLCLFLWRRIRRSRKSSKG